MRVNAKLENSGNYVILLWAPGQKLAKLEPALATTGHSKLLLAQHSREVAEEELKLNSRQLMATTEVITNHFSLRKHLHNIGRHHPRSTLHSRKRRKYISSLK